MRYWNIDSPLSMGIVVISLFLIKLLSPVQDNNRPISPDEMQTFGKKLNYSILVILILSVIFYGLHLERMLLMISVTTLFMVGILVLGKLNYRKSIKESQKNQSVG